MGDFLGYLRSHIVDSIRWHGVGLKFYVPGMGPLSIDYGVPLTNPGSNGNKNGYFTFGVGDIMY